MAVRRVIPVPGCGEKLAFVPVRVPKHQLLSSSAQASVDLDDAQTQQGNLTVPPLIETNITIVYCAPDGSPVCGSRINGAARWAEPKSNRLTKEPANASNEPLPSWPKFQLSSMNRKTED